MSGGSIRSKLRNEEIIDAVLATSATRTQSALHETMCTDIENQLKSEIQKKESKKKIDVKRNLSEEQLQSLNDLFPERMIYSSGCERGTHNMAAATRKIELDILINQFSKLDLVYDVGGNWATHVKREEKRLVHCCCPIIDVRDEQRKQNRLYNIRKFGDEAEKLSPLVVKKLEMLEEDSNRISDNLREGKVDAESMDGRLFCQNKFERCVYDAKANGFSVKHSVGIAIHSIYDIELDVLVDALRRKNIKKFVGTFLFSPEILLGKKKGELPFVDGFFEVEGGAIRYGFYNDPNCGYVHSLASLCKYLTKTFVECSDGGLFYMEITDIRGDTVFFALTDVTGAKHAGVEQDNSIKFIPVSWKDKVVFPVFDICARTKELYFEEELLPKSFINRALEYVDRLKSNQLNCQTVHSYLASTNNVIVVAGAGRKVEEKVDPRLLPKITTALVIMSEVQRRRQSQISEVLTMRVKENVSAKDIFNTVVSRLFGSASLGQRALRHFAGWLQIVHGQDILKVNDVPRYVEVKDRYNVWLKSKVGDADCSLNFSDLAKKQSLYEEYEREREEIVEKIVHNRLKAKTADHIVKNDDEEKEENQGRTKEKNHTVKKKVKKNTLSKTFVANWIAEEDDEDEFRDIKDFFFGIFSKFERCFGGALTYDDEEEVVAEEEEISDEQGPLRASKMTETKPVLAESDTESDHVALDFIKNMVMEIVLSFDRGTCEITEESYSGGSDHSHADSIDEESSEGETEGTNADSEEEENEEERERKEEREREMKYWAYLEATHPWVRYAKLPERPVERHDDDFRTLAKKEYMWYLQCKLIADKSTLMDIIGDHCRGMYHSNRCEFPKNAAFFVVKNGFCSWIYGPPRTIGHAFAVKFDEKNWQVGGLLQELLWAKAEDDSIQSKKPLFSVDENGTFLICDVTFLMNEMIIMKNLCSFMKKGSQVKNPAKVVLIDGVPGCGKSSHIVKEADLVEHFVLTMGKEAALDLKERFKKERAATAVLLKRVRTVDSFLMHEKLKSRASVLHFDEALMAHAGMVFFCADNLRAKTIVCQGDSQQIPFVNRVESITLKYSKLKFDNTVEKRLTYRSPLDVAAYLTKKNFYGTSVVMSANNTLRSLKTVGPRSGMTSIQSIPKIANWQYLTFTQSEKEDLIKYLGKGNWGVNTVHESQGKTYDSVALVRLKPTDNEIYPGGRKSNPYVVVGVTRHRRSLVYYTKAEDKLFFDITEMMSVQEGKLQKHLFESDVQ